MTACGSYQPLLALDFRHSFYADGTFHDLLFSPSPETASFLGKFDLLFKKESNVVTIYYNHSSSKSSLVALLNQRPLAFSFHSRDPYFFNFTEPSVFKPGFTRLYRLSNAGADATLAASSVSLGKTRFLFKEPATLSPPMISVLDWTGTLLFQANPDAQGQVLIDIQPWGSGLYQIQAEGAPSQPWYLEDTPSSQPPLGVFWLCGNDLAPKFGPEPFPTFYIVFGSRMTCWRYYLFGFEKNGAKSLRIIDKTDPQNVRTKVTFEERGFTMFSNQQKALLMESSPSTPIALQERPGHHFQLQAGEEILVDRLAYPSRLLAGGGPGGSFCSDIFIYHP
jgi:hypothetical protein